MISSKRYGLCYQSHDLNELNEDINSDLKILVTWLESNKLLLNVAKTHSMLISTKQKGSSLRSRNEALELKIRDNELDVVQKTKYLGVQIDYSHMELLYVKLRMSGDFLVYGGKPHKDV